MPSVEDLHNESASDVQVEQAPLTPEEQSLATAIAFAESVIRELEVVEAVEVLQQATDEEVPETRTKEKKPPFNLTYILDKSYHSPEDIKAYNEWQDEVSQDGAEWFSYPGWRRYEIIVWPVSFTVIAKKAKNGGYHIREVLEREL